MTSSSGASGHKPFKIFAKSCHSCELALDCAEEQGWTRSLSQGEADLWWCAAPQTLDMLRTNLPWRKFRLPRITNLPGMKELAQKAQLFRVLNLYRMVFPDAFAFFPQSFVCLSTEEVDALQAAFRAKQRVPQTPTPTWIVKPAAGRGGAGIFLTQDLTRCRIPVGSIIQRYVETPLLLDSMKFDLRIYVLVTSVSPLRILLHPEGLVRLATTAYRRPEKHNIGCSFMHLTNYSINKYSEGFMFDEEASGEGTKRRISDVNEWLREEDYDVDTMWLNVERIIVRTMIALQPFLLHHYEQIVGSPVVVGGERGSHLIGFDVLLDSNLRPWLLEINANPSLGTPDLVDEEVKEQVVGSVLRVTSTAIPEMARLARGARTAALAGAIDEALASHAATLTKDADVAAAADDKASEKLLRACACVPCVAVPTMRASATPEEADVQDGEFELLLPDPQGSVASHVEMVALSDAARSLFNICVGRVPTADPPPSAQRTAASLLTPARMVRLLRCMDCFRPRDPTADPSSADARPPFTPAEIEALVARAIAQCTTPTCGLFEFFDLLCGSIVPRLYPTAVTLVDGLCAFFTERGPLLAKALAAREIGPYAVGVDVEDERRAEADGGVGGALRGARGVGIGSAASRPGTARGGSGVGGSAVGSTGSRRPGSAYYGSGSGGSAVASLAGTAGRPRGGAGGNGGRHAVPPGLEVKGAQALDARGRPLSAQAPRPRSAGGSGGVRGGAAGNGFGVGRGGGAVGVRR